MSLPFRKLERLDEQTLAAIKAGVVFVNSEWSGNSRLALEALTKALKHLDFSGIDLLSVDCGDCHLGFEHFAGIRFGGYGETFWVKNDRIVHKLSDYSAAAGLTGVYRLSDNGSLREVNVLVNYTLGLKSTALSIPRSPI